MRYLPLPAYHGGLGCYSGSSHQHVLASRPVQAQRTGASAGRKGLCGRVWAAVRRCGWRIKSQMYALCSAPLMGCCHSPGAAGPGCQSDRTAPGDRDVQAATMEEGRGPSGQARASLDKSCSWVQRLRVLSAQHTPRSGSMHGRQRWGQPGSVLPGQRQMNKIGDGVGPGAPATRLLIYLQSSSLSPDRLPCAFREGSMTIKKEAATDACPIVRTSSKYIIASPVHIALSNTQPLVCSKVSNPSACWHFFQLRALRVSACALSAPISQKHHLLLAWYRISG